MSATLPRIFLPFNCSVLYYTGITAQCVSRYLPHASQNQIGPYFQRTLHPRRDSNPHLQRDALSNQYPFLVKAPPVVATLTPQRHLVGCAGLEPANGQVLFPQSLSLYFLYIPNPGLSPVSPVADNCPLMNFTGTGLSSGTGRCINPSRWDTPRSHIIDLASTACTGGHPRQKGA